VLRTWKTLPIDADGVDQFASVIFDTFWHWRATFGNWKLNPYKADDDEVESASLSEQPAAHWTSPSLYIANPPRREASQTPPAHNDSSHLAPMLDFDTFNAFPDWEWAAEVPLAEGIDLAVMSQSPGV
jgi:hypothetical protein